MFRSPLIEGNDPESCVGEWLDLVAPGEGEFRKPMEENDGRAVSPVINRKGDTIRFYCSQPASRTKPPHYALSDLRHFENFAIRGAVVSPEVAWHGVRPDRRAGNRQNESSESLMRRKGSASASASLLVPPRLPSSHSWR